MSQPADSATSPTIGEAVPAASADPAEITVEDLGEIVRIVDPELDVDAILAEIRANLAKRPKLDPDPSSFVYRPADALALSAQSELEWTIEQAGECQRDMTIPEQLHTAPGVAGTLATRLKRPLHQLARFYVELYGRKQAALDSHVVRALGLLAQRSATTQDELAALRQQVAELRGELEALRAASGQPTSAPSGMSASGPTSTSTSLI